MQTLSKYLAASAGVLALAAATAGHAATVTIWVGVNGGPLVQEATGTDHAGFSGVLGGFQINDLGGNAGVAPVSSTQALDTVSEGPGGDLEIWVSEQGITGPLGNINWLSTFTTQPLSAGWTLTENTLLSTDNLPQVGTLLGSVTMGASGIPQLFFTHAQVDTLGGPYAINTEYVLHASGAGTANSTIGVFNEGIPEPTTWGLMIMGFGGVGALLRNRRRQVTFA